MLMQHIGKFLFLLFCIFFFVFFFCVKDRILGSSCFISSSLGAQTTIVSLNKRTYWCSAVGSDHEFICCSTAAERCWLVSNASHLDFIKPLTLKEITRAAVIVIFQEPIICRSSYLLEIGRHMQQLQVQSFLFLRILDCPRFSNRSQERLLVGRGRHDAFILDACQWATFMDPVRILSRCYFSSRW